MADEHDQSHGVPFQFSPGVRLFLLIVLVPSTLAIPFLPIQWNGTRILVIVALELLFAFVILGLATRSTSAWRVVCGMLFLVFLTYFIIELQRSNWQIWPLLRTPSHSPAKALLGLIGVGIPAMKFALTGRLLPGR